MERDDLVAGLRFHAGLRRGKMATAVMREAADRIEALEQEIARLRRIEEAARQMRAADRACVGEGCPTIADWHAAERRVRDAGNVLDAALAAEARDDT